MKLQVLLVLCVVLVLTNGKPAPLESLLEDAVAENGKIKLSQLWRIWSLQEQEKSRVKRSERKSQPWPSYVLGADPLGSVDVPTRQVVKFTAQKKFSVFSPPHGNAFPFGEKFFFEED